jgi:quinol monooxygenase YgiN
MGTTDQEVSIVAHFTAVPGQEMELLKSMQGLPELTNREPRCIRYELNREIDDSAAFTFAEKFVNRAAFDAHVKMPYSVTFSRQAESLMRARQIRVNHELLPSQEKEPPTGKDAIIVIAHFTAVSGKETELRSFFETLVAPTRAEPGCIRYELNQDLDDPSTFTFVETFADRAAFDAHCATPYVAKLFELLPILVKQQYIGLHRRVFT